MDQKVAELLLKGVDLAWLAYEAGFERDELQTEAKAKIASGEIQTEDDMRNWLTAEYKKATTDGRAEIARKRTEQGG